MTEELSKAQQSLLEECKKLGWGTIEVIIEKGEPVFILKGVQRVKLD